jgi:hypothetical protein
MAPALSFAALRAANVARCVNSWKHALDGWSAADWLIAVGGELGESLNVLKKLNRDRDGIVGNSLTLDALVADFADELADTAIYLDLFLAARGLDFFVGPETFAVLGSMDEAARFGAPPSFGPSDIGVAAMRFAGELAAASKAGDVEEIHVSAIGLMGSLHGLGKEFGIDLGAAVIDKFNRTSIKRGFPDRLELAEAA